jgi:hypothetical protein
MTFGILPLIDLPKKAYRVGCSLDPEPLSY